mmetsp:Transcript_8561/g.15695  ORF Transcript_8561/g.15695 Transcript_8561/m.15695 type:complete len:84 (+) Transcript_8561:259-510(+)
MPPETSLSGAKFRSYNLTFPPFSHFLMVGSPKRRDEMKRGVTRCGVTRHAWRWAVAWIKRPNLPLNAHGCTRNLLLEKAMLEN